ncbi:phage tail protein [Bacillus infantis]|jgi:hypothetical protein|uniref:phage tail protein n=1 Tax=Bacillus infantis TaxID=324767 RepID=UPI00321AA988
MNVVVNTDTQMLNDVRERLGTFSRKAPNAISSALNRAVTNVSSNVSKEVRKKYTVKSSDIKQTLSKTRASRQDLHAIVKSKGELLPLDRFKVSPRSVQPKRKKPIKVAVKKEGLKPLLGAFVGEIHGTKVFKRVGKKRLPIRRLFGPSIPQMIENEEVRSFINQEGNETFNRRLDHEINRILAQGANNT